MLKNIGKQTARIAGAPRNPRRARPGLETLEGRSVPATFTVTTFADVVNSNDDVLSLREAIDLANITPGADTIRLRAGVYRIGLLGPDDGNSNARGDFDVSESLTIVGAGAAATAVEANTSGARERLFDALGPIDLAFASLTLRNAGNGQLHGGAVQALSANVRLDNAIVAGNAALKGGAINAELGTVTLNDTTLRNNIAVNTGGAVNAEAGNVVVNRSVVEGNRAILSDGGAIQARNGTVAMVGSVVRSNVAGGAGGGVAAKVANLTASTVSNNSSQTSGGGIFAPTATLVRSTVSGNATQGDGGGVRSFAGQATLIASTVSGNSAVGGGGGIAATAAALTSSTVSGNTTQGPGGGVSAVETNLLNSTISGNRAGTTGGGVFAFFGTFLNATITRNNSPGLGGGVMWGDGGIAERIEVKNTIIADNFGSFNGRDVSGDFLSRGHNLIGIVTGSTGFGAPGDQFGSLFFPLNPRLAPLANNGGPTMTHALLAGSTAIDRGNNNGAPAVDQRGVARPRDGDGNGSLIVDIGAFER